MLAFPFAAAAGLAVGSFLNLCAYRIPRHESIFWPGSHCDGCRKQLGLLDLVPVFSYLCLRGRCRHCGCRLPALDPVVEAVTAVVFLFVIRELGTSPRALLVAIYASLFILIGVIDLRLQLIPNRITYPWAIGAATLAVFWPSVQLWQAGAGAALGFLAFAAIYAAAPSGIGFGDVKLAAVIGLIVGLPLVLVALGLGAIFGGAVGATLLLLRRRGRKDALPFGLFLSTSAIVTLLWGPAIWQAYLGSMP